jgi:hypothetical protein
MKDILAIIEYLGLPLSIAVVLLTIFLIMQFTGEVIEWCGKTAPMWLKLRKMIKRKPKIDPEYTQTLIEVKQLLEKINEHYSEDNISQRNEWMSRVNSTMQFVDQRSQCYDNSIDKIIETLQLNTKMTEDLFVEFSRDRIMAFAEKAVDPDYLLSREQFNRIERIYNEYEEFLDAHNRENGEVDMAWEVIQEGRRYRMTHHSFVEDIKRLPSKKD